MKKEIFTLSIFIMMVFALIAFACSANNNNTHKLTNQLYNFTNNDYNKFLKDYGQDLYNKCPVMLKPIEPIDNKLESQKPMIVNTPKEFTWMNYNNKDWTTVVKHQGYCGSCWDFAAVGVLESVIKIRENCPNLPIDLSEQYVLSCLSSAGSCHGGSGYEAFNLIINTSEQGNYCNGIIPESCMPYQANDDILCDEKCSNWEEKLVPIKEFGYYRPDGTFNDREVIKTTILQKGPVATCIAATSDFSYWGLSHHDPTDYYPSPLKNSFTNHLVIIVGWKDDHSIRNGGYWICKNSWGTYWGYEGFFNIEYNSLHIDDMMILWADYNPEDFDWYPVANAGEPKGAKIGEEITFDASNSFDDNEIISYHWDFGDGTSSTEINRNHMYEEIGVYTVNLTVTDINNQVSTDSINVWIQENNIQPNKPLINGKVQGQSGKRYEYTLTADDPENNDVYFYVDWGDNSIDEWIGPYKSGEEALLKHRWDQQGEYTLKVKSKDVFNEESEWTSLKICMPNTRSLINQPFLKILLYLFDFFQILK